MRIKIGDLIKATVEGVDEKGRGTFRAGGKEALAYFVIPGEKIEGEVAARTKGMLRVSVDKIVEPSPDRVGPRCQFAGRCGGCPWMMVDYDRQCALKLELVEGAFTEAGLSTIITTKNQQPNSKESFKFQIINSKNFIKAKGQFYHRNRMDYVFGPNGELGLKEPEHWDKVLDINECFILSEAAVKVMNIVRDWMRGEKIEPWDNRRHTGALRYLVIREGKNTNERLVMIVTSAALSELPNENGLASKLKPLTTSLIHGINPEITDLSIPKTMRAIIGKPYLLEKINGLLYQIPPASFFQTNSAMAAVLQDTVVEFAAPKKQETLLDLYCGNGFLTLALAQASKQVIGVELDEPSIEIARTNAALNKIKNAIFSAGAAEALLPITLSRDRPDCIVLDPPRVGLHPKALAALMEYGAKRLVYVSCNPRALARDLKTLRSKYSIEKIRCIDLFPHTPHIETIVSLARNYDIIHS